MIVSANSKAVIPSPFKRISENYGQLHPQLVRTGAVVPYHQFGYNQKENQENGYIILFFLNEILHAARNRSRVGFVVGVDIFRPESLSRLKFVDSAALVLGVDAYLFHAPVHYWKYTVVAFRVFFARFNVRLCFIMKKSEAKCS